MSDIYLDHKRNTIALIMAIIIIYEIRNRIIYGYNTQPSYMCAKSTSLLSPHAHLVSSIARTSFIFEPPRKIKFTHSIAVEQYRRCLRGAVNI